MISLQTIGALLVKLAKGKSDDALDIVTSSKKKSLLLSSGDLDTLLGDTILTPTIVVDESLRGEKYLDDLIKLQVELFVKKYTTAVTYLTNVQGLNLDVTLQLLSTYKDTSFTGNLAKAISSFESNEEAEVEFLKLNKARPSFEAAPVRDLNVINHDFEARYTKMEEDGKGGVLKETDKTVNVSCKALIKYATADEFMDLLKAQSPGDTSLGGQLTKVYQGLANVVTDLIFASNLINDYRGRKLRAKAGLLEDYERRAIHGKAQLIRNGAFGFGSYFNMFIMNEHVQKQTEAVIGGTLEKKSAVFLDRVKSMTICMVDTEFEALTLYSKTGYTTSSIKSLSSTKNSETSELIKYMVQKGV